MLVNLLLLAAIVWSASRLIVVLAYALLAARLAFVLVPTRARVAVVVEAVWPPARGFIQAADARRWTRLADVMESLTERLAHRLLGCGCVAAIGLEGPCREHAGPEDALCLCPGHGQAPSQIRNHSDDLAARRVLICTGAALLGRDAIDVIVQRTDLTPERAEAALRALDADWYLGCAAREDPDTPPPPTSGSVSEGRDDGPLSRRVPPLLERGQPEAPRRPASDAPRRLMQAMVSAAERAAMSGEGGGHVEQSEADRGEGARRGGAPLVRPLGDGAGGGESLATPLPGVQGGAAREAPVTVDERRRDIGWTGATWAPPACATGAAPSLQLELREGAGGALESDDEHSRETQHGPPPPLQVSDDRMTPTGPGPGEDDDQAVTRPIAHKDLAAAFRASSVGAAGEASRSGLRLPAALPWSRAYGARRAS
jgi:hypothetical protein